MKVLIPGHTYELANFENKEAKGQIIQFIQKEYIPAQPKADANWDEILEAFAGGESVTVFDGTTNEELLEVLIHRIKFQNNIVVCEENDIVIVKLQESLMWLNKRTTERQNRNVEGKQIA